MKYKHDCEKCEPLGEFGNIDLYFCNQAAGLGPTVIARYSSEGSDYQSGLYAASRIPELAEARKRAIEQGLIIESEKASKIIGYVRENAEQTLCDYGLTNLMDKPKGIYTVPVYSS